MASVGASATLKDALAYANKTSTTAWFGMPAETVPALHCVCTAFDERTELRDGDWVAADVVSSAVGRCVAVARSPSRAPPSGGHFPS